MGRRRGFLPPTQCQQCGTAPGLGQTLFPSDPWRCLTCLESTLPGKDGVSQSMLKMVEYRQELNQAFDLEARGSTAVKTRNRAEWARFVADEIYRRGKARSKELAQAKGEAISPQAEQILHDTLTVPDLAAVEASFERVAVRWPQCRSDGGGCRRLHPSPEQPGKNVGSSTCSHASTRYGADGDGTRP